MFISALNKIIQVSLTSHGNNAETDAKNLEPSGISRNKSLKYFNFDVDFMYSLSEDFLVDALKQEKGLNSDQLVYLAEILSEKGDLVEAAQHLFSHMRQLDQMDVDTIVAERVPEEGLGRAINDKLRRASF